MHACIACMAWRTWRMAGHCALGADPGAHAVTRRWKILHNRTDAAVCRAEEADREAQRDDEGADGSHAAPLGLIGHVGGAQAAIRLESAGYFQVDGVLARLVLFASMTGMVPAREGGVPPACLEKAEAVSECVFGFSALRRQARADFRLPLPLVVGCWALAPRATWLPPLVGCSFGVASCSPAAPFGLMLGATATCPPPGTCWVLHSSRALQGKVPGPQGSTGGLS